MTRSLAPAQVLFDGDTPPAVLPPCDHYAGSEKLMLKSLSLQRELGPVFDVTLDCEDGAAVGQEARHAELVASLLGSERDAFGRVGVRIHDYRHPAWQEDLRIILGGAQRGPAYVMLPKIRRASEAAEMCAYIETLRRRDNIHDAIPVHVLIETHEALADVFAIAALPPVESLSFGLMDFVSAHHGAVPDTAMRSPGQFDHPLVRRAKVEIAAACHAHGKVASHNVTTEIRDLSVVAGDAQRARDEFAYTRMWSIHPAQIGPIVEALTPKDDEIALAAEILLAAQANHWGPIRHHDTLHDRASYRYYWSVLRRAHATSRPLPASVSDFFTTSLHSGKSTPSRTRDAS
ncbi:MAG TPA: aldolase/citrate lyase family protein [Pararobbsia sp.]|nr:aldolase/citrate lyase family protein [Pararobbsia sp.]